MANAPQGYSTFNEDGTLIGLVGPIYLKNLGDCTTTYLQLEKRHSNPLGMAHGGLMMTLLDITLGSTAAAYIKYDGFFPTVQLNCNFLAAAKVGDVLEGTAKTIRASRTLSFVSGQLEVAGVPIVTGTAIFRNPSGFEIPRR